MAQEVLLEKELTEAQADIFGDDLELLFGDIVAHREKLREGRYKLVREETDG